jgi:hypothetical protein
VTGSDLATCCRAVSLKIECVSDITRSCVLEPPPASSRGSPVLCVLATFPCTRNFLAFRAGS